MPLAIGAGSVGSMKIILLLITLLLISGCSQSPQNTQASNSQIAPAPPPTPERYRQELEIVRRGNYRRQRLMNKSEERVYRNLVSYCDDRNLKVFSQVSLGEILSAGTEYYRFINAKRIDFCITDHNLMPVAAVEYQGSGHFNETSEERDEVKRTAIESADLFYISVNVGSENEVGRILDRYFS